VVVVVGEGEEVGDVDEVAEVDEVEEGGVGEVDEVEDVGEAGEVDEVDNVREVDGAEDVEDEDEAAGVHVVVVNKISPRNKDEIRYNFFRPALMFIIPAYLPRLMIFCGTKMTNSKNN
jgi:hypothetical protein